jgi:hypothetical protein
VVVVALAMAHRQPVVEDIQTARLAANDTHHPPMSGGAPRVDAARYQGGRPACVRRIASLTAVVESLRKEGTIMAPGRARDERKERQWRRLISQWQASGLSMRAFCARHGLATASFYNWRRVLERRGAANPLAPVTKTTTPAAESASLD